MSELSITSALKDAFKFPFESEDGRSRFLIGSLISLANLILPIVPAIFVYGYVISVMRQVINGEKPHMPAWNDWGKFGLDGLKALLVGLVYMLPATIISAGGWVLYTVLYTSGVVITTSNSSEWMGVVLMFSAMVILFLSLGIGMFFNILGGIPLPVALSHWVAQDRLSAAFNFKTTWQTIKADKWGYFITWGVILGVGTLLYLVCIMFYYTIILCFLTFILMIPAGFYLMLVALALFGQFYRDNKPMEDQAAG